MRLTITESNVSIWSQFNSEPELQPSYLGSQMLTDLTMKYS